MANELMNPGPPDTAQGYGNASAAGYYGLQQELLRRAMLARQQQEDELNRQRVLQEIEASKENVASSKVQRESTAALNAERANKLGLEQATTGLTPGAELTPNQKKAIVRFGGAGLVKSTPGMTAGVPTEFAQAPDAASAAEVPVTQPKDTYAGTADQQALEQHRAYAQKIVDGLNAKKESGAELSPIEQEQLFEGNAILMTGKSATAPAGTIVPKTATEKDQTKYLDIFSRQHTGKPVSPEDAAWAKGFEGLHPDEATKQRDAVIRVNITQTGADKRQTSTQLFQTKQNLRKDLNAEDAKLVPDLERVDRAEKVLNSKNFIADAIAAPEVLQIMAGGMGSGLRMTDAELNRVNQAQTKLDQLRGAIAKYGLGTPVTIQEEMRKQMKTLIDTVKVARQRKAGLLEDTLRQVEDAVTPEEVDKLRAGYWNARRSTDAAPKTRTSKYTVSVE